MVYSSTLERRPAANSDFELYYGFMSRMATLAGLGLTYGGARDLYQQLGYKPVLQPEDFWLRFERGDIAERIVNAYPSACWKDPAELVELSAKGLERDNTPFVKEWRRLLQRTDPDSGEEINLFEVLKRLDVLVGLGRYAILVLGLPGNLEDAVRPGRYQGLTSLAYLHPYAEEDVEIDTYETDRNNRRFGQPVYYRIYPGGKPRRGQSPDEARAQALGSLRVHWSRVLHVAEGATKNPLFGRPRLQAIYNRLEDLDKVVGGGAEAFWKNADRGIHADLRDGFEFTTDPDGQSSEEKLRKQIFNYVHRLGRFILTQGVDINHLGAQVADPQHYWNMLASLIAGTIGIPKRILFGSELGELASSQDQKNWYDQVDARRKTWCTPVLRRLINRLQRIGILPETPYGYDVRWPASDPLTEEEKAAMDERRSNARLRNAQAARLLLERLPALAGNEQVLRFVGMVVFDLEADDLEEFIRLAQAAPAPTPGPEPRPEPQEQP